MLPGPAAVLQTALAAEAAAASPPPAGSLLLPAARSRDLLSRLSLPARFAGWEPPRPSRLWAPWQSAVGFTIGYIYNVALRLGVPIKGASGLRDGIGIFPRQDKLEPGEFGNALRGPLGVHRANNHRYWFYDAPSDVTSQLSYLKSLKKLTESELTRLSRGMTIPDEFLRKPTSVELPPRSFDPNRKQFSILDYVRKPGRKGSGNYFTQCPSCAQAGNDRAGDNLAISISDPRKYKCWAGCTKEMIRAAVGQPIRRP